MLEFWIKFLRVLIALKINVNRAFLRSTSIHNSLRSQWIYMIKRIFIRRLNFTKNFK